MQQKYSKEDKLKNSLKKILAHEDLKQHQELMTFLSAELGVSALDCATALWFLNQPKLSFSRNTNRTSEKNSEELSTGISTFKFVRYRLNVGRKHQVLFEEIKNILVDVAGVDRARIGKLDIRNYYTLVDLPDGMPADIFQLLSETELRQQKLKIKRIKFQNRFHRSHNKSHSRC